MQRTSNKPITILLYLLSFIILWQCVKPITVLTILKSEKVFFVFVTVSLLLSFLRVPALINVTANGLMILYVLHFYYFQDQPFFSQVWIRKLGLNLQQNMGALWQGNLQSLSDIFTTFILFVLLWLISIALNHWLDNSRRFFLFIILALVLLSVLDTVTFYNADRSIIIVIITGFIVMGIQKYSQMSENGAVIQSREMKSRWMKMIAIAVAIIVAIGLTGPKFKALWPSPQPFLTSISAMGINNNGSIFAFGQRIGYDEDDTRLGGPLGMDSTTLFTVHTSGPGNYWRVASKTIYTGKGWKSGENSAVNLEGSYSRFPALPQFEKNTKVEKQSADFIFSSASPSIFPYTGQLTNMNVSGRHLKIDRETGRVTTSGRGDVHQETIRYLQPTFQIPRLRQIAVDQDPSDIRRTNLQLPRTLPERVRDLAHRITDRESNRYDKTMAVVHYLRSPKFTYSTDQVAKPAPNQDYVDQFLFESRTGYCDNFSTSMVVLLRAAGIPARWVKGFSTGTYMGEKEDKVNGKKVLRTIYEISNSDAHSWVEAYFPGSGWVTFEPTPSFNDPSRFTDVTEKGKTSAAANPAVSGGAANQGRQNQNQPAEAQTQKQKQKQPERDLKNSATELTDHQTAPHHGRKAGAIQNLNRPIVWWSVAGLMAALLILVILFRKRWLAWLYIQRQKRLVIEDRGSFHAAYRNLFRLLKLKGLERSGSQTLREYARTVDQSISGNDMLDLTKYYETTVYSDKKDLSIKEKRLISRLFESVVSRIESFSLNKN
ncbi:transglutaminase [Sporolactobacillus sp. THM7-4]|nr:transglutaminase [Sporolactobacillus sp. THM7-4]